MFMRCQRSKKLDQFQLVSEQDALVEQQLSIIVPAGVDARAGGKITRAPGEAREDLGEKFNWERADDLAGVAGELGRGVAAHRIGFMIPVVIACLHASTG